MAYIKLEDLQKFPIRKDHYDKVHGNEHFIYGVESVLEYAEYLPTYDVVPRAEIESIKTETAKKIIAEILSHLDALEYNVKTPRKTVKVEELKAQVNWVLHEVVPKTLANIEKNYEGE